MGWRLFGLDLSQPLCLCHSDLRSHLAAQRSSSRRQAPPEPLTGTFITSQRLPLRCPVGDYGVGFDCGQPPTVVRDPYWLQILTNGWLMGMVALSVTLGYAPWGKPRSAMRVSLPSAHMPQPC